MNHAAEAGAPKCEMRVNSRQARRKVFVFVQQFPSTAECLTMKKAFVAPILTEEAALATVTLAIVSGQEVPIEVPR